MPSPKWNQPFLGHPLHPAWSNALGQGPDPRPAARRATSKQLCLYVGTKPAQLSLPMYLWASTCQQGAPFSNSFQVATEYLYTSIPQLEATCASCCVCLCANEPSQTPILPARVPLNSRMGLWSPNVTTAGCLLFVFDPHNHRTDFGDPRFSAGVVRLKPQ